MRSLLSILVNVHVEHENILEWILGWLASEHRGIRRPGIPGRLEVECKVETDLDIVTGKTLKLVMRQ